MTLIAIPVRNRVDLTRDIVTDLVAQGDRDRILVYDNGSTDETPEWLAEHDIATMDAPRWNLHEMWNDAIDRSAGRGHLVLLNNDLRLDGKPDWIDRLVQPLETDEWDVVCPNYDRTPVVDWKGPVLPLRGVCRGQYDGSGGLAGFAFAISAQFLATGYRFPEALKWWYGDNDLVCTLDEQARKCGMVVGVGVTHVGGGSQTAKEHDLEDIKARDQAAFEEKWGVVL